jgi:hypothetical protein
MTAVLGERGIFRSGGVLGLGALAALCVVAVSGCAHAPNPGGLIPHLGSKPAPANAPQAGIGVNAYLWRATLDTLAFMPLASADPFGGVVITDWYVNPEKVDERLKATVYILDTRLRADGLNVTVFKQTKDASGNWVDAPVAGQTDIDIENAILTRARQLRLANLNEKG